MSSKTKAQKDIPRGDRDSHRKTSPGETETHTERHPQGRQRLTQKDIPRGDRDSHRKTSPGETET